jgi:phage-related protein
MPDYNLGRASGKIEIDYDGSGVSEAIVDLDKATASSEELDKSLTSTQKTLQDTDKQFGSSGSAVDGYNARLRESRQANEDVARSEKAYKATLLDSKATIEDVSRAHEDLERAQERQSKSAGTAADAHKALSSELSIGQVVIRGLSDIIPNLESRLGQLADVEQGVSDKSSAMARGLGVAAKAVALLGPEGEAAGAGLMLASKGIDKVGSAAKASAGFVESFVKDLAGFEVSFGKISGLSLALPSLGGLAGLGAAGAVQGIVEIADAVEQLSGALALLPAVVGGVGVVMGTMKVAFQGVDSALKDMMADDPKKFLEDISKMGPAAAHSMLQLAQFRDQFKAGAGAVQDSFFAQISNDMAPLIQTWLPALVSGGSKVAGVIGGIADGFGKLLMQPQTLQAFSTFIDNISKGLQAMQPGLAPLLSIFTQLSTVGSSFFGQIGGDLTLALGSINNFITQLSASGDLQAWIQSAINGFGHLFDIAGNLTNAFGSIMSIADKFGGGGLLGFLDKLTDELNGWTSSSDGQKALAEFFSTLRTATDAFTPMLGPLLSGITSIGSAFVQLGVATSPAWLDFFKTFAATMSQLGPDIVGIAPSINTFLDNLGAALIRLVQSVGPQLPQIFEDLSNAFVALLPQIPQLVTIFTQLVEQVGPQLPQLFDAVTQGIEDLIPLLPQIIGLIRTFVSGVTDLVEIGSGVEKTIAQMVGAFKSIGKAVVDAADAVAGGLSGLGDDIAKFFDDLPNKAMQWGKNLVKGLVSGMLDSVGLNSLDGAANSIVDGIAKWFQSSPAQVGPFSGAGYTLIRGQQMVKDMASGMVSAQSSVAAAGKSTANAAAAGLNSGTAGAAGAAGAGAAAAAGGGAPGAPTPTGAEGVTGALLPDRIAKADTSILTAYLRHQFDPNRGLKGFSNDMGKLLSTFQSGLNLVSQHVVTPGLQALGMIPALKQRPWEKMPQQEFNEKQIEDLQRKALQGGKQGPTWGQLNGTSDAGHIGDQQIPLGVGADSSKQDIQKAIIAAGRGRGLNDAAIQTALAVAAAESGFNPTVSGGVQGSAGLVSGLFQQSPSSGWGTLDQVNDPNHAINSFFDAFSKQLASNPGNPLLAGVLTQNPQLGSGAQGSAYWNAVSAQLGLGGQILTQLGPGVKGPSWQQLAAGGGGVPGAAPIALPPGAKVGHDGSLSFPAGTQLPQVGTSGASVMQNPNSRASSLGPVDITPDLLAQRGISPLFEKSTPDAAGGKEIPAWAVQFGQMFGLSVTDHPDTTLHGGEAGKGNTANPMGSFAFDFSGAAGDMDRFSQFIMQNLMGQTLQLIHRGPAGDFRIAGGQRVGPGTSAPGYYDADIGGHSDHVHFATDVPPVIMGANGQLVPVLGALPPGATPGAPGTQPGTLGPLGGTQTPFGDVNAANGLLQASQAPKTPADQQMLQPYLQANPDLAGQIAAAQTPGASDQTVQGTLNSINSSITGLQTHDAVGNANTIKALQSTQNQIAQSTGFQQQQSPVQFASSVASAASGIAGSVIQTIQGGLDSLTATQDIADHLVYGVRNTQDVSKLIDDVQKYITFASDIANTTGQVLSTIGGIAGAGGDAAGPGGGAAGAALSSAGQIASLISGALQGVNAAIDFGQQVGQIAGGYVGKFLSQLTAGPGGANPLEGNVGMLLNTNTNQLLSYSEDNPQNQNATNVPGLLAGIYGGGGGSNPNPQVSQQVNVYGSPGMSAGELMNETMWHVKTQGTTGALQAANF